MTDTAPIHADNRLMLTRATETPLNDIKPHYPSNPTAHPQECVTEPHSPIHAAPNSELRTRYPQPAPVVGGGWPA